MTRALFGLSPESTLTPASPEEAQEAVRRAAGRAVVPWGGGTRQALGHAPARYDVCLSTARLDRITDHQPADLTVTAQAGVTITRLQQALAAHGQFLPLDVARPDLQTVGGVVAARAHSLRRLGMGGVRDALLGVTVLNGRGEWVRGGGKVVKNVSGYDLPKLYCGSLGTLGLIAEATFKVASLPPASATALLPLPPDRNTEDVLDALLGSDLSPSFLFLINPGAARSVLPRADDAQHQHSHQYIAVGFDGPAEAVAWQVETLGAGALDAAEAEALRARLRDFALDPAPMTAAFHILSSQVGAYVRMAEWTARRAGFEARVAADAALGLVHAHFAPARPDADWLAFYADLKDKAGRVGGSFIVERMPDVLRAAGVPVWLPLLPDLALMRRLKDALDPDGMWNPGRFVGGI